MLFRLFGRLAFLCKIVAGLYLALVLSGCNNSKLTVLHWNTNGHSDVSDVFYWDSADDAYLADMRIKYDLIALTINDTTDLDRIATLCDLINHRWDHTESDLNIANDPMCILQQSEVDGKKLTCLEEAYVLAGYLSSIDIPARVVTLIPKNITEREKNKAHFIVEAYPKEIGKWIMIDPILKEIPLYHDKPINAVQLRRAIATDPKGLTIRSRFGRHKFDYKKYISDYLYYFEIPIDNRHEGTEIQDRTQKSVLLYPLGSPRPYYFLDKNQDNILYTTSLQVFYNPPVFNNSIPGNPLKIVMDSLVWDRNYVQSDLIFKWNRTDDPYLIKLREQYCIDTLVTDCKTSLDSVLSVMHWVHGQWEHYSGNLPEMNDPITILKKVRKGMRYSCLEYSAVLAGCLNSLGFTSRVVDLNPVDVETKTDSPVHVVVEVYIPQYNKWIYADPQWDVIPMLYERPLNAVEFQDALWKTHPGLRLASHSDVYLDDYTTFVAEYLYFFVVYTDNRHAGSIFKDRSNQKIMLVTAGADSPRTIQGYVLKMVHYTNILAEFYVNPQSNRM
ncbi:transglutaminase-like domain-containing protein [bacterium]|nr:transglutaminase-like domain-containing protein [bacterium]